MSKISLFNRLKYGTPEWDRVNGLRNKAEARARRRRSVADELQRKEFDLNQNYPWVPYTELPEVNAARKSENEAWALFNNLQNMTHPKEEIAGPWAWGYQNPLEK